MNRSDFIILWKPKNKPDYVFCNINLCNFLEQRLHIPIHTCPRNSECEDPRFFDNTKYIPIATLSGCNYRDYGCSGTHCNSCIVTKIIQNKYRL